MFKNFMAFCRMIKIEHSIFALPFAYSGIFLAERGMPPWEPLIYLTLAMVAIRSFAMAFNRLVDLPLDSANPRTQNRPLVSGEVSVRQTKIFCILMALGFIGSSAALNTLCLWLSLPTLIFAAAYSYTKRFTWLCHFWLGATLGLAPLAGWISIKPELSAAVLMTPILFFFAVLFWVAGFDIFYSCQDVDFDQEYKLHSIPASFGLEKALALAAFSHAMTVIFLLIAGFYAQLSWWWYALLAVMAAILLWEHRLVHADDLRRVNMAFFTLNGLIAVLIFAAVLLGIFG